MLRQEPNLGEDKGGLLGPEKDKCKVCSLLDKAHKFWVRAAEDSQFCQAIRYQIKMEVRAYRHDAIIQSKGPFLYYVRVF